MFNDLKADFRRYQIIGSPAGINLIRKIEKIIFLYGLHALLVYRYGRWVRRIPFSMPTYFGKIILMNIYHLLNWYIKKAYDIDLDINAEIGPGLLIGHFGGITVGPCTMGRNCSIQQHVQIIIDINSERIPKIGSNVWIGGHSKIVGCHIGDYATVSTGTLLRRDLSTKNLAGGNPGRVLSKNYDNSEILGIVV